MRRQLTIIAAAAVLVALALPGIVLAADRQVVEGRAIPGHGTLMVATSDKMTLYTFDKDVAGSGVSTCTGGCLTNWPALTIPAGDTPIGGAGVTGTLGTIVRTDDGTNQVTYDGLPLYFFIRDEAPGDTTGIYTDWQAIVLAAAPPQTSIEPGAEDSSPSGSSLPLAMLASLAALGFVAAIRRLASARA